VQQEQTMPTNPLVFISYAQFDDNYLSGELRRFRDALSGALQFVSGNKVGIFQEGTDVAIGEPIQERISQSLSEAMVLVPVVTPSFFTDPNCQDILSRFLERERQLGRNDLVLAVYYQQVPVLEAADAQTSNDQLLRNLAQRHMLDWQSLRGKDFKDPQVRQMLESLARRIIEILEEGTNQREQCYQTLQSIQQQYQSISSKQLIELWEVLERVHVSHEDLEKFYHRSVLAGTAFLQRYEGLDLLACMLHTLAQQSTRPGKMHPIISFAAQFLFQTDDPIIQNKIRAWINIIAEYLRISQRDVSNVLNADEKEQAATPAFPLYMLIDLEPKAESPDRYLVQAWVWSDYRKQRIYAEDTPHSLEAIPQLINTFLENIVHDQLEANSCPVIEFFLPGSLLDSAVDQWVIEEEETLGFRHSVVIRFRKRATDKKYWPAWKRRWNEFDPSQPVNRNLIEKIFNTEDCFTRAFRLRLDEIICLVLTGGLTPGSEEQHKLVAMILRSGTPIALWARTCMASPDAIRQAVETLTMSDILERLPDEVWQCRRTAWAGGAHLPGNHLTLLWDDFNRLPHTQLYAEGPEMNF
jgi:hypothetical protein